MRRGYSNSEVADLVDTIDKFLSESPDASIIIPLFSLAFRGLLTMHFNATGKEPLCIFYCESSKVSVCLSNRVSADERAAVKYFLSASSSFNKELCIEICRKLSTMSCFVGPEDYGISWYSTECYYVYYSIYSRFFSSQKDAFEDFAFFMRKITCFEGENVYIPFASERLLSVIYDDIYYYGSVSADWCNHRAMAYCWYQKSNYPLDEEVVEQFRPNMQYRDLSQWFDRAPYGVILCELPDNDYQAEYLVDKLLSVKYDRAYILVPASFLAGEENLALRKRLSESGRISEVLSLPDFGKGDYALIRLDDNVMQVTRFIDVHGMYMFDKDEGKDEYENLEILIEALLCPFGLNTDGWEEQYIDFPSPEFRNNGYILNPKYHIKHTLSYEGDGECEYVKLGDLISSYEGVTGCSGEMVLRCNYNLAPDNEFVKPEFRKIASDDSTKVVDKDCLVCCYDKSMGFNANRLFYWHVDNAYKLSADKYDDTETFVVDTDRVDPDYLIHQLYRKETYLQIRQRITFSGIYLGWLNLCSPLKDILIPLPKAKSRKESLAIQKQIYERKKKIFSCLDDAVTDLPTKGEEKTSLSPIAIDKNRIITFVDYNTSFRLPTKMFALYVFLMRTSVDERGIRIDITHKNIADYHYEIGRIYYAVKIKLNDYRKSLPDTFSEEYESNVKNIQDNAFSELINKTNKKIEEKLKGIVSDEIIEKYQIPSGANKSRNVVFDAEITVDSGFPKDFFSESNCCYPNSHYSEEELIKLDEPVDALADESMAQSEKVGKYYQVIVSDDEDLLEICQNLGESHRIVVENTDIRQLFTCKKTTTSDGKVVFTPLPGRSGALTPKVKYVKLYNPDSKHYLYLEIRDLSYENRDWKEYAVFRFEKVCDTNLIRY